MADISGVTSTLDGHSISLVTAGSNGPWNSPTITTSFPNDFVVSVAYSANNNTSTPWTIASPFVHDVDFTCCGVFFGGYGHWQQSTAGNVSGQWTDSNSFASPVELETFAMEVNNPPPTGFNNGAINIGRSVEVHK